MGVSGVEEVIGKVSGWCQRWEIGAAYQNPRLTKSFEKVIVRNRQIQTQTLTRVQNHFFGFLKKFNGIYLKSILVYDQHSPLSCPNRGIYLLPIL